MKNLFAWVAMAVCVAFAGAVLAQDKPAATPDKPAAGAVVKEEAKPAAAAPTPQSGCPWRTVCASFWPRCAAWRNSIAFLSEPWRRSVAAAEST